MMKVDLGGMILIDIMIANALERPNGTAPEKRAIAFPCVRVSVPAHIIACSSIRDEARLDHIMAQFLGHQYSGSFLGDAHAVNLANDRTFLKCIMPKGLE